jgi:hypothetical protein
MAGGVLLNLLRKNLLKSNFFTQSKNKTFSTSLLFRQEQKTTTTQQSNNINNNEPVLINNLNKQAASAIYAQIPPRKPPTTKQRLGQHFLKIWGSFFVIIVCGITTFYYAKKEVDQNRQLAMRTKKDIFNADEKYPNRLEMARAEQKAKKEREALEKQQKQE